MFKKGLLNLVIVFFSTSQALFGIQHQFDPALFAAFGWVTVSDTTRLTSTLERRIEDFCPLFASQDYCDSGEMENACNQDGFWLDYHFDHIHQKSSGGQVGFDCNENAFSAGFDHFFFNELLMGFAVGYSHDDLRRFDQESSRINNYYFAPYVAWFCNGFALDVSLLGGIHQFIRKDEDQSHHHKRDNKNYGNSFGAHFGTSYGYDMSYLNIQPFATLDYFYFHTNKDKEHHQDHHNNFHVHPYQAEFLRSELGLALTQTWCLWDGCLKPIVSISYVNFAPMKGSRIEVSFPNHQSYHIKIGQKPINQMAPSVSLEYTWNNCLLFRIAYDGMFGNQRQEERFTAGFNWNY